MRDDVVVVAVSLDEEGEKVRPYLASMGFEDSPVTIWRDPEAEANRLFGGEKLPDTYFVNEAGEYIDAFINVRSWGSTIAVQCVRVHRPRRLSGALARGDCGSGARGVRPPCDAARRRPVPQAQGASAQPGSGRRVRAGKPTWPPGRTRCAMRALAARWGSQVWAGTMGSSGDWT